MAERSIMAGFASLALLLAACGNNTPAVTASRADNGTATPAAAVTANAADPAPTPGASAAQPADLAGFWTKFTKAALANDAATIQSLSAPVVQQHGTLDDDPIVKLRGPAIAKAVAKLLASTEEAGPSGKSLRQMMSDGALPPRDPQQPATYYRVGDLVFEQGASGWRLTQLYLDSEE